MSLSGEQHTHTVPGEDTENSPLDVKRPESNVPSCVSIKSDKSMVRPIQFQSEEFSTNPFDVKRPESPVPSCVSIKSNRSMVRPIQFQSEESSTNPLDVKRPESPVPSWVSMKSDQSMVRPIQFQSEESSTNPLPVKKSDSPVPSCVSMKSDQSMVRPIQFQAGESSGKTVEQQRYGHPKEMDRSREDEEERGQMDRGKEEEEESGEQEGSSAEQRFEKTCEILPDYKTILKKRFQCLAEGMSKQGKPTVLNEIYTEVYITEGGSEEVNNEHEVRQIEAASKRSATYDTPIKCNDIFKPLPGQDKDIRTVLTKGVAGIGKTVSVQKFILDWAEEKANQDVHFIFPLPFRELNLVKKEHLSLVGLIKLFFGDGIDFSVFNNDTCKVLFIFDGLDECRLTWNFHSTPKCSDVTEATTVSALLTNLIKGNLLPSALLWITSRPAAANQIPPKCVHQVTEVRGFNDPQKEEYIRKRIRDVNLASRTISHLKSFRSLFIMCHIPVFCWIAATVIEIMLRERNIGEIPQTLTQMYTRFLMIQTQIKQKYTERKETDEGMIFKLGKLAFQQLQKGNLIFYEEDLRECCIDITEASVYSGVCTQIFKEEAGLYHGKVFCFVHLSIQEHLAALYVHLTLVIHRGNVFKVPDTFTSKPFQFFRRVSVYDLHKSAVDLALRSENGCLDHFLRFLLGLSLKSNQSLLRAVLPQATIQSQSTDKTVQYIKKKIGENPSSDKCMNLFHCLNELNDQSLVKEIQSYLSGSGGLKRAKLSPAQWSAVAFVLLTSEQQLDEFDLKKYGGSEDCLLGLMSVVKASRSANLHDCGLTEKSGSSLAAALSSGSSLRHLNLRSNDLQDSGVTLLSTALRNPLCELETLTLWGCKLTEKSCSSLAAAISSGSSLRELNLSWNDLHDSGVEHLSAALGNPLCQLETLELRYCQLTGESCSSLAAALSSGLNLRQLDLSYNNLEDAGVTLLIAALGKSPCQLKTLKLCDCKLTEKCCSSLASLLSSGSSLRQLHLSKDDLKDSGVKLLSAALGNPLCQLENLKLWSCNLSEESCYSLASALSTGSSLRQLNLGDNILLDSGVKHLSAVLGNPLCQLETLELCSCQLTEKSCNDLASALSSGSSLRHLDLRTNNLQDSDVEPLSALLRNHECKLQTLNWR